MTIVTTVGNIVGEIGLCGRCMEDGLFENIGGDLSMRKLWLGLAILSFPFSIPVILLLRRWNNEDLDVCFSRPSVECLGCPDLEYSFRKRGIPPLAYVEDVLLVCSGTGAKASVAQGRLRKALSCGKDAVEDVVEDGWIGRLEEDYDLPYIM